MTSPENWSRRYLGYEFSQPALLESALTHRSYSADNNERLEFLGDAVLGAVIADILYRQESDADEGTLTRLRISLVRGETLAEIAAEIDLGNFLILGGGEARSGGHQRKSFLEGALEAVFAAVFHDGGYAAAHQVIAHLFAGRLANLPDVEELKDPKTTLQEALQANGMAVPDYRVLAETGPPHERQFEVECRIEQLDITTNATASSRRGAEQQAAADALMLLGKQ